MKFKTDGTFGCCTVILVLTAAIACFLAMGCERMEYGPELIESAVIYDTCFVPSGHGSDMAVGYNAGKGGGLTFTPIDIDIPARYAIVFKCQHGKFVIEGDRAQEMYARLSKGDNVVVRYCEKIIVDGSKRSVVGLHFIAADKVEDNKAEKG